MPRFEQYESVYQAYQQFIEKCILGTESLLWGETNVWTNENLEKLKTKYINNYMEGGRSFWAKLDEQLAEASIGEWMILADVWYVYYLVACTDCTNKIRYSTKKENLQKIAERAKKPLEINDEDLLWKAQRVGLVGARGQFYNRKDGQFRFILRLVMRLRGEANKVQIISNQRQLQQIMDEVWQETDNKAGRQIRHALLYMVFPESYEPIIDDGAKKKIINAFDDLVTGEESDTDAKIEAIRRSLSSKHDRNGIPFRFYDENLRRVWDAERLGTMVDDVHGAITEVNTKIQREILETLRYTKNIILYGPPGCGKTYWANQIAQIIASENLQEPPSREDVENRLVTQLKPYDILALAMYLADDEEKSQTTFEWSDLEGTPIVKKYLEYYKQTSSSLSGHLREHASNDNQRIKATRRKPFIFDQTENDLQWFLSERGKQYVERELCNELELLEGKTETKTPESLIRKVTFHQSFAYEDFVEGLRPVLSKDKENPEQLAYTIEPGILREICYEAALDKDNQYVLIIDEINRGNISKIFGELITLIEDDKRSNAKKPYSTNLPYSRDDFSIPSNLFIIGTMNTADRSIALLDVALRRRFAFVELMPNADLLKDITIESSSSRVDLRQVLNYINNRIKESLGRDYQIGHSYFLQVKQAIDDGEDEVGALNYVWNNQIMPLIAEYFYTDPHRLENIIFPFVKSPTNSELVEIERFYDDELISSLAKLTRSSNQDAM